MHWCMYEHKLRSILSLEEKKIEKTWRYHFLLTTRFEHSDIFKMHACQPHECTRLGDFGLALK